MSNPAFTTWLPYLPRTSDQRGTSADVLFFIFYIAVLQISRRKMQLTSFFLVR
jgi:hypothetical protein